MKLSEFRKCPTNVLVLILVSVLFAFICGLPPEGPQQVTATALELIHRPSGQLDYPVHTDLWNGAITTLHVRSAHGPCATNGAQQWSSWKASPAAPLQLTHLGFLGKCERVPMGLAISGGVWELKILQPAHGCLQQLTVGFLNDGPELSCDAGLPGLHLAEAAFGGLAETNVTFEATNPIYAFEQRVTKNAASMTLILKDALRYHRNAYQTCMANASARVRLSGDDWKFLELEARTESRTAWLKMVSRNDDKIPPFEICEADDCSSVRSACKFDIRAFFSLVMGKLL